MGEFIDFGTDAGFGNNQRGGLYTGDTTITDQIDIDRIGPGRGVGREMDVGSKQLV